MIKKSISFVLAICMILIGTGTVFADDNIDFSSSEGIVTVTVGSLGSGEETTLLVVKEGLTIAEAFDNPLNIYYVDQVDADSNGNATFNFEYSSSDNLTVYSGYASMTDEDAPFNKLLDMSALGGDTEDDFTYGDVNNDSLINVRDVTAVINHILRNAVFIDAGTKQEYPYGKTSANVNGDSKIDVRDVTAIINKILRGTLFPVEQ